MPLFMDVHEKLPEGASAKDVAQAHAADVKTQDQYGVKYMKYWVDEKDGKVFCLVEAPDAATAEKVHRGPRARGGPHLRGPGRLLEPLLSGLARLHRGRPIV